MDAREGSRERKVNMRQSRRVLVPVLALALVLCQLESAFGRDRVIVERREKGYRLRASSAWKVDENPSGADAAIRMVDPPCSISVARVPATGVDEITESYLKNIYAKSEENYGSRTFLRQKLETHRGKPSGWFEFSGDLKQAPGRLLHSRLYFTLHRDYLYVITVWAPEDVWEKSRRHWEAVVESMEFL